MPVCVALLLLSGLGVSTSLTRGKRPAGNSAALPGGFLLAAGSVVATFMTPLFFHAPFYYHYLTFLVPGIVLLSALGCEALAAVGGVSTSKVRACVSLAVLVIFYGWAVSQVRKDPLHPAVSAARELARVLMEHRAPTDRLLSIGEPHVLNYANMMPPSRLFYPLKEAMLPGLTREEIGREYLTPARLVFVQPGIERFPYLADPSGAKRPIIERVPGRYRLLAQNAAGSVFERLDD